MLRELDGRLRPNTAQLYALWNLIAKVGQKGRKKAEVDGELQ